MCWVEVEDDWYIINATWVQQSMNGALNRIKIVCVNGTLDRIKNKNCVCEHRCVSWVGWQENFLFVYKYQWHNIANKTILLIVKGSVVFLHNHYSLKRLLLT